MENRENGDMYNSSRQIKQTYLIFPEQDSEALQRLNVNILL